MGALKSPKCSRGHPLKDPNLYYRKDGQRQCKACTIENVQESRKGKKKSRTD